MKSPFKTEFIGVCEAQYAYSGLKKFALFFDKIHVLELEYFMSFARTSGYGRERKLTDLDYLIDNDYISSVSNPARGMYSDSPEAIEIENTILRMDILSSKESMNKEEANEFNKLLFKQKRLLTHLYGYSLRDKGIENVPIYQEFVTNSVAEDNKKNSLVGIVLKELPIPDALTSWEKILEYKKSSDTQEKYFQLRRWIQKTAAGAMTASEAEDELLWLMHEFERHMSFFKMKTDRGTFETIITTVAEVAEDIVHLKFGAIAKALFSLSKRGIEATEAEMSAPGKEVAFIVHAKERFAN